MKITIEKNEIEKAIEDYVTDLGFCQDDQKVTVTFDATKTEANIQITTADVESKPLVKDLLPADQKEQSSAELAPTPKKKTRRTKKQMEEARAEEAAKKAALANPDQALEEVSKEELTSGPDEVNPALTTGSATTDSLFG